MTAFDDVYAGERVLVTGDTGFKGAWLAWWLHGLGADVRGLALPPATRPSLFVQSRLDAVLPHRDLDIREVGALAEAIDEQRPRVVFHLAAQAIVRTSYEQPVETLDTNVMGTAHLLDAVRRAGRPCAVVVVTSDKAYENRADDRAYVETDRVGGHDPYSASKGAAELVVSSYRRSFFPPDGLGAHGVALASARAGNVIGPGDWARDRIVPDAVAALAAGRPVPVRNPDATRPWQHVLEPLAGYLWLGRRLLARDPAEASAACEAWNFGPDQEACRPVRDVVSLVVDAWGGGSWELAGGARAPHEAPMLRLGIGKAVERLGWRPSWGLAESLVRTVRGYRALSAAGDDPAAVRALLDAEIGAYTRAARDAGATWAAGAGG